MSAVRNGVMGAMAALAIVGAGAAGVANAGVHTGLSAQSDITTDGECVYTGGSDTPSPSPGTAWYDDAGLQAARGLGGNGAGVRVAVIDSGVNTAVPGLAGVVAGGHDYVQTAGDPGGTKDSVGHGTAVADILAGRYHNGFQGVAPDARVLSYRMTTSATNGDVNLLVTAIGQAVRDGARVINISQVVSYDDPDLRAAVRSAYDHGALVVAAAGNSNNQSGNPVEYPAAYSIGGDVLAVGAVDATSSVRFFSEVHNYLDVVAPGDEMTVPALSGSGYCQSAGTSFAAPYVVGVAALMLHRNPNLTPSQLMKILEATARRANQPWNTATGWGIVDPQAAVSAAPAGSQLPTMAGPSGAPNVDRVVAARSSGDSVALSETTPESSAQRDQRTEALVIGGGAVVAGLLVLVAALVRRDYRKRRAT